MAHILYDIDTPASQPIAESTPVVNSFQVWGHCVSQHLLRRNWSVRKVFEFVT